MNEITVFEQFEADIVAFEEHNAELTFNIETPEGEQECKQYLKKLRKVYNGIEKLRKATKAEYIEAGRQVDREAKSFQTRIDAMHEIHNAPLKEKEARIQAEIDRIAREAEEKKQAEEQARLDAIAAKEAELKAKEDEIKAKEEAARIEAEKKAAVEQAKKDAEEKAERDRKEAIERAEREKQEAIEKAEREKQAAIEAEKEKARKIEAERLAKEEAERKEKERLAEIERKRQADESHREGVEQAAFAAISKITESEYHARLLIDAICENKIPHVIINY
jgi:hypothetical protein